MNQALNGDAGTSFIRDKDLPSPAGLGEWLLAASPIAIIAVAAAVQPNVSGSLLAVLLRSIGAVSIVAAVFWTWSKRAAHRRPKPIGFIPIAWLLCGAYLGFPLGPLGIVAGVTSGLAVWMLGRDLVRRNEI
jgi:hypothetical protein